MASLRDVLAERTRDAAPSSPKRSGAAGCGVMRAAIAARFPKEPYGVCKVRYNEGGRLRVPWGYVAGVQCDPVEKKPFFHAYPGSAGLQRRHARLRPPLQLLPELGDLAGTPRSGRRRSVRAT